MADTLQHGSITGNASVRQRISGEVVIGGKVMKELRFLPYSEFPEIGREETLYIDTDNNVMYYYDGSAYVALSGGGGGGTDNYNALSNKPSVNSVTLIGNKTSSELGLQELISDLSAIRSGATSGSTAVQPETLETALSEKQDAINDLDDIRSGASAGATAVQPSDMESALADKQDVISDLSTIRSGAASGATAVQPDDMETALSSKQDVISDLSDIRSGASAGATAVQPADMETALADKQDVISDLDTIRSGATAGNTALQPEDVDTLPTDGSSNPVSSGGTYNFVNSSIATNTAYFIGTFASVAELEAYSGIVTNNDYAFVTSTDSAGNTLYNRYKYNAATQIWSFEYAVNNTAFTTAQWAAIQSGMTSADKTKLDGIETGANKTVIDASPTSGSDNAVSSGGVHTALSGKQDTIADLSDIRSGASAGATAVQPSALNDYQTKLSGTNKLDPSYIDYDASHRAVSDTEKSTWNGKQDTISDLSTIRSGAAAGATALQQSDVASTYSASGTAPVNGTAVNAALGTLDVSSVGGSGKYISAISEEDGKIAATPITFDTALSSSSTNNNAPTSKAVYDDQQWQEVEIGVVANRGAKNLFKNTAVSKTYLGVVFTVNEDGTVSLSGAATTAAGVLEIGTVTPPAGSYIVSGCPAGGSWAPNPNKYRIRIAKNGAWLGDETGSGYTVIVNGSDVISLQINSGVGVDTAGLVFKPMIRPAEITDSTFQPYALPNPTLTPAAIKAVDEGAKNFLDISVSTLKKYNTVSSAVWDGPSYTQNGITYAVNSDGTISVSGMATSTSFMVLANRTYLNTKITRGRYSISGCPTGGGSSGATYRIFCLNPNANISNGYTDTGNGYIGEFYYDNSKDCNIAIGVGAGCVITDPVVFKPMLCTAADWAVSQKFVPYAMSNVELTAEVKNITPTIIKDQSTSVGTSYTLISSLTQTTTSGKLCRISAIIAYRNYRPRGIVLSYSNDSSNFDTGDKLIAKTETAGDSYELSASAIISRNNIPVYVWAKSATAGAERIYSIMEQLGDL